jgi:hypothetical protein
LLIDGQALTPRYLAGVVRGTIKHIGPSYDDFVSSFTSTKEWKLAIDKHYDSSKELERLRKIDEAYTQKLLDMSETEIAKFQFPTGVYDCTNKKFLPSSKNNYDQSEFKYYKGLSIRANWASSSVDDFHLSVEPRSLLADNHIMGLASAQVEKGDLVVGSWNCNLAAIFRSANSHQKVNPIPVSILSIFFLQLSE